MKGVQEVRRRVLSAPAASHRLLDYSGLDELVLLLGGVTREFLLTTYGSFPEASPEEVDTEVTSSTLMHRLTEAFPGVLDGPMQRSDQLWTVAGATEFSPHRRSEPPRPERLKVVVPRTIGKPSTGFFTSTQLKDGPDSMWTRYLERLGGSLFPLPHTTYRLTAPATTRVAEVQSARELVDLVERFPLEAAGLQYPDWTTIGRHYDAVHLTAPAVVATQGIALDMGDGRHTGPMFWDVETTLWLRWAFETVHLLPGGMS